MKVFHVKLFEAYREERMYEGPVPFTTNLESFLGATQRTSRFGLALPCFDTHVNVLIAWLTGLFDVFLLFSSSSFNWGDLFVSVIPVKGFIQE